MPTDHDEEAALLPEEAQTLLDQLAPECRCTVTAPCTRCLMRSFYGLGFADGFYRGEVAGLRKALRVAPRMHKQEADLIRDRADAIEVGKDNG